MATTPKPPSADGWAQRLASAAKSIPPELLAQAEGLLPHELLLMAAQAGQLTATWMLDNLVSRGDTASWASWRAFLCAVWGLPMSDPELAVYRQCTRRESPPLEVPREAAMVVGRRGGKSLTAALLGLTMALYRDYSPYLAPGERGYVLILSRSQKEARSVLSYIKGMLGGALSPLVSRSLEDSIELTVPVTIEVVAAQWRGGGRSRTVVGAICDEIAFWRSDDGSVNPDAEILRSLRPTMATIPNARLIMLSSPYARRGVLWDTYDRYYGKPELSTSERVLVWKAPTWVMHPPTEDMKREIEREFAKDPVAARAEYGAEFRADIEAYVPLEIVEAATRPGRLQLPPQDGIVYYGFVDPAGGGADAYTLGIAHFDRTNGKVILDCLREWTPSKVHVDEATKQAADTLKLYRLRQVTGDRYGGEWPVRAFRSHDILYLASKKTRSDIYIDFVPQLMAGRVELLDNITLKAQLLALNRTTSGHGKDIVDHPPGGHDDTSNAAAGACVLADLVGGKRGILKPEEPGPATTHEILTKRIHDSIATSVKLSQSASDRQRDGIGGYTPLSNSYLYRRGR